MSRQPFLHDLTTCVRAPTAVLSSAGGDIRAEGAHGVFHGDLRVLSEAVLRVAGQAPEPIRSWLDGPSGAAFVSLARDLGDPGPDPTVRLDRRRLARPDGLREHVRLSSSAGSVVRTEVTLDLAVDLARIHDVKAGAPAPDPLPANVIHDAGDLRAEGHGGAATWSGRSDDGGLVSVRVATPSARLGPRPDGRGGVRLAWTVAVEPRESVELTWELSVADAGGIVSAPAEPATWTVPQLTCDDVRLPHSVERSLQDLDALRLEVAGQPGAQFLAAGSPWFLTLFGRDSLWTARMLLPTGVDVAAGTLEVLAARQGERHDETTAEAPGKILHELRRAVAAHEIGGDAGGEMELPPVYFGTVDATSLWVLLLHDAWCWGLDLERVEVLMPHLERAMSWITGDADADGDGFLEYIDRSGHGLANQGWKDSGDSVRFRDGSHATGAIALAEVQGYAHESALAAARLLTAFGQPGEDRLRTWAEELAARFRASFWVEDAVGPYPAMALDGAKRPVDALASNAGHLLGTGLLTSEEAALIAGRLSAPDMDSGHGLRTMSSASGGYSPLSYHCGSIWPHDTAIVALGLAREGFRDEAAALAAGLLEASSGLDYRLPELYAGDASADVGAVVPYPAACRPQAWAAAAGVAGLQVLLGLRAEAPGRLVVAPPRPMPVGALSVAGLQAGGQSFALSIDREGKVLEIDAPAALDITVRRARH